MMPKDERFAVRLADDIMSAHRFVRLGWVCGLLTCAAAMAEDWPQWRGTSRDGTWGEPLSGAAFPAGGVPILWRVPAGAGWASPVIAEGRVFLADVELKEPQSVERIRCFDELSGRELWVHTSARTYPDWALKPGQENGPTSTPVIEGGRLYSINPFGDVVCLAAATGALVWERRLGDTYEVKEFTVRGSPLVEGALLIVPLGGGPDACVVALDKSTGTEVWHAIDEPAHNSSPIVVSAAGRRQLIMWTQQSVTALDPATGAPLWRERLLTDSNNGAATPVFDNGRLLISGLMFRLHQDPPGASVLWPDTRALSRRILSNTSTPFLRGGLVFAARSSGALVCLDAASGRELWSDASLTSKGNGAAIHLTAQGDTFLLYNDQGEVIRARLTATGCEVIGRAKILEPDQPFGGRKLNWAAASYANGRVFARNHHELVCASLTAGTKPGPGAVKPPATP
jgi:outer membrane protein assembly factor BamB